MAADPPRVVSSAEVLPALRTAGACILEGAGSSRERAAALPEEIFGAVLAAAPDPRRSRRKPWDLVASARMTPSERTLTAMPTGTSSRLLPFALRACQLEGEVVTLSSMATNSLMDWRRMLRTLG